MIYMIYILRYKFHGKPYEHNFFAFTEIELEVVKRFDEMCTL